MDSKNIGMCEISDEAMVDIERMVDELARAVKCLEISLGVVVVAVCRLDDVLVELEGIDI